MHCTCYSRRRRKRRVSRRGIGGDETKLLFTVEASKRTMLKADCKFLRRVVIKRASKMATADEKQKGRRAKAELSTRVEKREEGQD